jgi:hypothetical protein
VTDIIFKAVLLFESPSMRFQLLTCFIWLIPSLSAVSQELSEENFTPCIRYDERARALKDRVVLDWMKNQERLTLQNSEANRIYQGRKRHLVKMINRKKLVADILLENYCNDVLKKIATSTVIAPISRQVLIHQSPVPNAMCIGRGSYLISIGLLAQLENENQLAFVLAHEMAHDELNHINQNIQTEIEQDLGKQVHESFRRILTGSDVDEEDAERLRRLLYQIGAYSRSDEYEADELAVQMIADAHYDPVEAINILNRLNPGSSLIPRASAEMFFAFDSEDYPIQSHWFNDRLQVFHGTPSSDQYISSDSLRSHPRDSLRVLRLASIAPSHKSGVHVDPPNGILQHALFECFEGAYVTNTYDKAITIGLYLLQQYPQHSFLVSRIAQMLTRLFQARSEETFNNYVQLFTVGYAEELLLTNNLLHNVTTKELGELIK